MVVISDREQHKCDYFFNDYLAFSNQVHNCVCVCVCVSGGGGGHIATAIKVTEFCTIHIN